MDAHSAAESDGAQTSIRAGSSSALKRSFSTPTLIVFGLAYMVPMTVFTTYGIVNEITEGHLAGAYVVTLAAMLFTAASYAVMSRENLSAGSAYAYARSGFGGGVGFITGWSIMIDYILLPMLNYLLIGLYLSAQFPDVPAWVFSMSALVVVTVLNIIGVSAIKGANTVLVALQVVFFLVFFVFAARSFDPSSAPLDPFLSANTELGPILAGAAILCLSFLGFDAISTLSEEAKQPERTVPRAIILTTLIGGLIFVSISWFAHMAHPAVVTGPAADTAAMDMLAHVGGSLLTSLFLAAYITGALGSALASQASVSRILYSMGRDSVIPKAVFGRLSERFRTPIGAILVVAVISLSALVADVDFVASIVSFGALTAFSLVNLAVISVFWVRKRGRAPRSLIRHAILPAIGFALTIWLWTSLTWETIALGVAWIIVGIIWLAVITRGFRRPVPELDPH